MFIVVWIGMVNVCVVEVGVVVHGSACELGACGRLLGLLFPSWRLRRED
jgi:hypothetical protein